jgi:hypothetical protein
VRSFDKGIARQLTDFPTALAWAIQPFIAVLISSRFGVRP